MRAARIFAEIRPACLFSGASRFLSPVSVFLPLLLLSFGVPVFSPLAHNPVIPAGGTRDSMLVVKQCNDFAPDGAGTNPEWNKTSWHALTKIDQFGPDYAGRIKMLYSATGIYVLFSGEDRRITTTALEDMSEIYEGDAFEVFLLPDSASEVYFEYEINPIGKELVLALSRSGDKRSAWVPWSRLPLKIGRKVTVSGGEMLPGAAIRGWTAELFFSYEVLKLISGRPPGIRRYLARQFVPARLRQRPPPCKMVIVSWYNQFFS